MKSMKKFYLFIFSFILMFISFGVDAENLVNTNPNERFMMERLASSSSIRKVTVDTDLIEIVGDSSVNAFYYNTVNNFSSSKTFTGSGGLITKANGAVNGYVSLKNGIYYFWVTTSGTSTGRIKFMYPNAVEIKTSCTNMSLTNVTGTAQVERCLIADAATREATLEDTSTPLATCADGYVTQGSAVVTTDTCKGMDMMGLTKRYCKAIFSVTCVPTQSQVPVVNAKLTDLSLSVGSLNPNFSSDVFNYTVNVDADVDSIVVNATVAQGASFVSGYGPRTVKLNYGINKIKIKVQNTGGTVNTYIVNVTRKDDRSSVNTLSNITVNVGTLSPAFDSNVTTYTVEVAEDVTVISVGATLTDNSSVFVENFGPRDVNLNPGLNNVELKVKNERGKTKTYTVQVVRQQAPVVGGDTCSTDPTNLALLKSLMIKTDIEGVQLEELYFDQTIFNYTVTVPFEVANLDVEAYTLDEGDTIDLIGGYDLEPNIESDITITVTSKKCPSVKKVYTISVTRSSETIKSSDPTISSIKIKDHDEFEFSPSKTEYGIKLKKGENTLDIEVVTLDANAIIDIEGNEELKQGDKIIVRSTSEDGESYIEYTIAIDEVEKGTNMFLVVIVVIIIVLVLIYLILRLLGYRIVINMEVISSFFRGIGEKIKNIFDK